MAQYCAYLRVYEPLSAFPATERRRWETYLADGQAPARSAGLAAEHRASVLAAIAGGTSGAPADQAYAHRRDGETYVCPWRTRLRSLSALAELRRDLPDIVVNAFVARDTVEGADRELQRLRTTSPAPKSYIRSETWQVPLRWFLAFAPEERHLTVAPERSLTYLTGVADARTRVEGAIAVLERTIEDGPITEGIAELGRWLADYHPTSLVELDYGGLVALFTDDELSADESADEIARAVHALDAGDVEAATAAYGRSVTRWGPVRAVEVCN